jgi:hypothetical protein
MFELIFTSSPRGLFPGKSGFCTVAMTAGMPPNLISPLENLSGYNFTYQNNQILDELNPPCCYYIKMIYGNQLLPVAGRIAANGLDHTRRSNKIAHHILFESTDELLQCCGAAELFCTENQHFTSEFTSAPCELPYRAITSLNRELSLKAELWEQLTGDGGLAGWIASSYNNHPDQSIYQWPS